MKQSTIPTNTDDTIDSREVIERISSLESELEDDTLDAENRSELQGELDTLKALADDCEGCSDWQYGATLIRDSYFEDYAQELAADCCEMPKDIAWPFTCIDWEQAARELQIDYTSVSFDGIDYWIRG